jgi:hypothetical protein
MASPYMLYGRYVRESFVALFGLMTIGRCWGIETGKTPTLIGLLQQFYTSPPGDIVYIPRPGAAFLGLYFITASPGAPGDLMPIAASCR